MKRGHIRVGRAFTKAEQESSLRKAGVKVIYYDDIDNAIRSCRKGEGLYVVGLRGLASSRAGIVAAIKHLHRRGAFAVDCDSGRRSDGPNAIELHEQAVTDLKNEQAGGLKYMQEAGRQGGLTYASNLDGKRTPLKIASKHWFDHRLVPNAVAVNKINSYGYEIPWSWRALYNRLGPRGTQLKKLQKRN